MVDPLRITMYKTNIMGIINIIQNVSLGTLKQGEINFNNMCAFSVSELCPLNSLANPMNSVSGFNHGISDACSVPCSCHCVATR